MLDNFCSTVLKCRMEVSLFCYFILFFLIYGWNGDGVHRACASQLQLLIEQDNVVMDNGIVAVTLSNPEGLVTGIRYNDIENVLEVRNQLDNRGYWDVNWAKPQNLSFEMYDRVIGTNFTVIKEDVNQIELSFTTTWAPASSPEEAELVPLNIDKRFIMLRNCSGFYSYAIYEHLEGWPDFDLTQTRIVFKLREDMFRYMAISDERQRVMPMPEDRSTGLPLAFPEAVLLTNPANPDLTGEVDDKYQYSCENKDNRVHGWISSDPTVGFWVITPSNEFRTGGPLKQDLTSHVGPISLSMFVSRHYAGDDLDLKFRDGVSWKKVFGPVFIYLNSVSNYSDETYSALWGDAKQKMMIEIQRWPYYFPASEDFLYSDQRGTVNGTLIVQKNDEEYTVTDSAYIGLAPRGDIESWQTEGKGYQFWVKAQADGSFSIINVLPGEYDLFAWVPGFLGSYKYGANLTIIPGYEIDLGDIVYEPTRDGPTLWEIGIPDRSAAEFYIPDPNPKYINKLYLSYDSDGNSLKSSDKFRQYGLWERYTELYPDADLTFIVGGSDYTRDWFFAQFTRINDDGTVQATTWQIIFELNNMKQDETYKLRIALASAANAELQVRFNDKNALSPHFTTGQIGKDNAIARHGIHGLYRLYNVDVPSSLLVVGNNTIFLTQARSLNPFVGVMYDYVRFEGPCTSDNNEV